MAVLNHLRSRWKHRGGNRLWWTTGVNARPFTRVLTLFPSLSLFTFFTSSIHSIASREKHPLFLVWLQPCFPSCVFQEKSSMWKWSLQGTNPYTDGDVCLQPLHCATSMYFRMMNYSCRFKRLVSCRVIQTGGMKETKGSHHHLPD